MEQITGFDQVRRAVPVTAAYWDPNHSRGQESMQRDLECKRTRSTLSLVSQDLIGLGLQQTAETLQSLFQLAEIMGRDEVLIENIEVMTEDNSTQAVANNMNFLQSAAVKASRMSNSVPPKIVLEKRAKHYDLRIYLAQ